MSSKNLPSEAQNFLKSKSKELDGILGENSYCIKEVTGHRYCTLGVDNSGKFYTYDEDKGDDLVLRIIWDHKTLNRGDLESTYDPLSAFNDP